MRKVKEYRNAPSSSYGGASQQLQSRVIEVGADYLVMHGAKEVAPQTKAHDWQDDDGADSTPTEAEKDK